MESLALTFSSGWASGINAYLVVLVLGVADRVNNFSQIPDVLTRWDVLTVAGFLYAMEFIADKIPYIDSSWDAISTAIRPTAGAVIGVLLAGDASTLDRAVLGVVGGGTALLSHPVKAGGRLAINSSPEPVTNISASSGRGRRRLRRRGLRDQQPRGRRSDRRGVAHHRPDRALLHRQADSSGLAEVEEEGPDRGVHMSALRIVVIGGGFGGMASAARLAKLGHEVTLIERSPPSAAPSSRSAPTASPGTPAPRPPCCPPSSATCSASPAGRWRTRSTSSRST
ncbi:DUF4126 domain-containing protein [Nocardioides sp. B-3]|uniref:DUF4126 domain-containing protein n=1 Tax=Nocardioides sp. B-3 TaxID=2895565 RepID=UPI002152C5D0|nr:FAD-dependent oxidoreductase [Nocardioides sp. B-3]UUZ59669.1 FAD-dependent oxidoreductase [Nocardioides sp. B-3]